MLYFRLIFLSISILASCQQNPRVQIFEYRSFGPQAMAYETIGYQWYEWNAQGSNKIEDIDNIKVVVYEGDLELVTQTFKDDKSAPIDYRYIQKKKALLYLENKIKFLEKENSEDLAEVQQTLKETKLKISL